MTWQGVLDNAEAQTKSTHNLVLEGKTSIQDIYHELYTTPVAGLFSNSLGSHLLPDLLTSPCVVVDLYDWSTPTALIERYGVDLPFLIELRDRGHIVLAANLEPERYKDCAWLHSILADRRTIFRSLRTPEFFSSRMPGFADSRGELRDRLHIEFERRSTTEIERLSSMTYAAHQPRSRKELADLLSIWVTSIRAMDPASGNELALKLMRKPEDMLLELRQQRLFKVMPYSGGLGGGMRLDRDHILSFFPKTLKAGDVYKRKLTRLIRLNRYLAGVVFNTAPHNLSSEQFWRSLTEEDRERWLNTLENKGERVDAMKAEATLRLHMLLHEEDEWDFQEIEEYVNRLIRYVDKFDKLAERGVVVTMLMLIVAGYPQYAALVGVSDRAIRGNKSPLGSFGRDALEFAIPKIQVVNFVKRHR